MRQRRDSRSSTVHLRLTTGTGCRYNRRMQHVSTCSHAHRKYRRRCHDTCGRHVAWRDCSVLHIHHASKQTYNVSVWKILLKKFAKYTYDQQAKVHIRIHCNQNTFTEWNRDGQYRPIFSMLPQILHHESNKKVNHQLFFLSHVYHQVIDFHKFFNGTGSTKQFAMPSRSCNNLLPSPGTDYEYKWPKYVTS